MKKKLLFIPVIAMAASLFGAFAISRESNEPMAVMADPENHTHDEITFTPWESDSSLPDTSGSYYLTKNVVLDSAYYLNNLNLNLDLNGYCIVLGDGINISLSGTATLNLYDCNGSNSTWYITTNQYYDFESISDVYSESALEFTGGCITGGRNKRAIDADNATFNMYGGTICCNSSAVLASFTTFNMHGGKIAYNGGSAGQYGTGVFATNYTVFNMDGGEISNNFARYAGSGVYLEIATFTMNGGIITHNGYSKGSMPSGVNYAGSGAGVCAGNNSTFTMNGGTISNNKTYGHGGGVYVKDTFIMNDGTISGNNAAQGGGGVSIDGEKTSKNNAHCTIAGGSIINNTIDLNTIAQESKGAGISFQAGTFILSGEPIIKDNVEVGGNPNNIYVNTFDDRKITLSGTLTNDDPYGITTSNSYTNKTSFTDVNCDSYFDNFVADKPDLKVVIKDDKSLYIDFKHIHSWKYTATGSQIEATCENADCPVTEGLTLELQAPTNLTYDGNAKVATFKTGYSSVAFPNPSIKYYQGTSEVTSCVNVGTYTAKVTFGTETAVLEFTITKATPTPVAVTDRNAVYGQSLSEITLPNGWSWNNPTDKVGNAGTNQHKATFTPEDTDNYNTVEQNVNVIVAKATPEYTVPTGLTTLVNKTLSTITLPAGWTWDDPTQNVGSEAGNIVFKGTFTPEDTTNYNIIEHVDITVKVNEHQHNWSYTASGATITASCGNPECPVTEGLTLELEAPASLTYDGNAKVATFKTGYSSAAFPSPTIKYYQGTSEVTSCVNVGTYQAKVTFDTATAVVEFTIAKATPSPAAVPDQNAVYGQSLSEIALPDGWSWNNPNAKVGNAGTNQHKATFTPEDTDNYNTVEQNVNVIVAKANPDYTVPTGLTALVNKTLSTVTLPNGWTWDDPTQNVGSEPGNKVFKGTFTPEDTTNYNIIEHVDITVLVTEHEHNWSYTASGATITASCGNPECPVTEGLTLTLEAPKGDLYYDGTAKVATLKAGYSLEAFPNATIKYFNNDKEVNQCVNVGKYTAKVTFGNAVAMVEFEILGKTIVDPDESEVSIEIDDVVVPENVELRVEVRADVVEKDVAEDYAKIKEQLESNEQISKVYDVKLIQTVGGVEKEIQPSDIQPGLKITVKMAIPEGIDINNVRILHIHSVNDMEFVSDYKIEGNELVFEIDRLSQFAFITKVNTPAAGGVNGGIIALIIILSILATLGVCFCLLFFVFAKFIIIKDKEGKEKVVRAIKIGKDHKDDKDYFWMFTFTFKKDLKPEDEVFSKKKDAEEFLKNKVQEGPKE